MFFCVSVELRVQKNTFPLYSFTYFSVLEILWVPCTNFRGSQVRRNFVRYFRCTLTRVVFLQVTCSTKMLEKETLSFFRFCSGYLLTIVKSEKSTKILTISDLLRQRNSVESRCGKKIKWKMCKNAEFFSHFLRWSLVTTNSWWKTRR